MKYLDYNATAPLRPQVAALMAELQALPLNPSSVHAHGRKAKNIMEDARRTLAEVIGVFPAEVIFTGSGTEANNWVLKNFSGSSICVSSVEHASLFKTAKVFSATYIPVTKTGVVDVMALDDLLAVEAKKGKPIFVSVMIAGNETGIIQPVQEIAGRVHKAGGLLHCDAVQAFGKIPFDFNVLGCDLLTISAHKMGGPVGVAALIAKNTIPLMPMLTGGGQELNRRAGTENIAAIAGFAKAAELIDFAQMKQLRSWLDRMEEKVAVNGATIIGKSADRLPNTSCIATAGMSAETQLIRMDLAGIAVSAGSACSSGRIEPSHVLKAMGVEDALSANAIRVSGGWATTEEDIAHFTATYLSFGERKKAAS